MSNRKQRMITAHGKTQSLQEWAREMGMSKWNIHKRLAKGWLPEEAVSTPAGKRNRRNGPAPKLIDMGDRKVSAAQLSSELGITAGAVRNRVRNGWTGERLLSDRPREHAPEWHAARELYAGANLKPWSQDEVARSLVAEFGALSREQVAAILGCSNERVRQIESEALAKLARHGRRWRDAS